MTQIYMTSKREAKYNQDGEIVKRVVRHHGNEGDANHHGNMEISIFGIMMATFFMVSQNAIVLSGS